MLLLLFPMPGFRDHKAWRVPLVYEATGYAVDGCDGCGVGDGLEKLRLG